jgi:chaperonin GroES
MPTTATKVTLKPLDDRVVVEPREAEETTAGGIVLPDTAREKSQRGKVIACGPGRLLDSGERAKMLVKKGNEVLYGKYAGTEFEINSEKLVILRESDVLAVIE